LHIYLTIRHITLKTEAIETLELLLKTSSDNTVRKRSHCPLLSHKRRMIIDLSKIFDADRRTIEQFDAYRWFQNLKYRLSFVLNNFGTKYDIIF
jgi:hypothetical protein